MDQQNLFADPAAPVQQPSSNDGPSYVKTLAHPKICFVTIAFRGLALLVYFLSGIAGMSFVSSFILFVLLLAADFWVVKNISGRILVGLRWWNEVLPSGETQWVYESREDESQISAVDSRFFWFTIIVFEGVWGLFLVLNIFSAGNLIFCAIALSLSTANAYGYFKCKKNARKIISSYVGNAVVGAATKQMQEDPQAAAKFAGAAFQATTNAAANNQQANASASSNQGFADFSQPNPHSQV